MVPYGYTNQLQQMLFNFVQFQNDLGGRASQEFTPMVEKYQNGNSTLDDNDRVMRYLYQEVRVRNVMRSRNGQTS